MTLFEPYSHTRLSQLREEQLARKARLREQLQLETALAASAESSVAALIRRLTLRPAPPAKTSTARPTGRPALDS